MLIPLALAALMTLAPTAVQAEDETTCPEGQVETPEGCSQQAWVDPEDCPPGHMCAADAGSDQPLPYGPDGCVECSGPVDDPAGGDATAQPGTCMDGADAGGACDNDVMHFGDGPADSGYAPVSEVSGGHGLAKDLPILPFAFLAVAILGFVLLLRWK